MTGFSTARGHSFHRKILTGLTTCLILALGLIGLAVTGIEFWLNEKRLRQDVTVLASVLGHRSRPALEFQDREAALQTLQTGRFSRHLVQVCLYQADETLFAGFTQRDSALVCPPSLRARRALGPRYFTVRQPVDLHDSRLGVIEASATRDHMFGALLFYIGMILMLILVLMVGVSHIVKKLLHGVTRPLEELHHTARALVENPYAERRATRRTDDEIGELAELMNRMLDSLAHENKALKASEHRFRALTGNAPIGIFQVDKARNLIYANDVWYRITGAAGKPNAFAEHQRKISAEDIDFYHAAWLRAKENRTTSIVEYSYQLDPAAPKYLMEHIVPISSDAGELEIIGTLADVTELKMAQMELEKLAFYDPLTHLPNRRFLIDLLSFGLAKAKRAGSRAAVLMMDMDNFKKVNDLMGHRMGDQVLKEQAARIRAAVREQDAVARMGGDEFTIVLSPVTETAEVTGLAKRVLDAVNTPVVVQNHTLDMGASIGVAMFPADGDDAEDLIRNADMALYEAKSLGRNRVNFFSTKLDLELREGLRLEHRLKDAIRSGGLQAFVQPQVDQMGRVVWGEALTRWIDPQEGFISPDRFIPLAEETGLITSLGQWILEEICQHLTDDYASLAHCGIKGVAVNLSGRQFFSRTLMSDIKRAIERHNLPPERMEFELTESVIMDDSQTAIEVMRKLRDLGCKLAIDDFGTGYSSLAYLKRFPLNALKVDRSFVEDIPHDEHGSEIATAIIAMAHKLKLQVVAEGVETEAQRDFLVAQGCDILQGYLFGKPRDISEYVAEGRRALNPNATDASSKPLSDS